MTTARDGQSVVVGCAADDNYALPLAVTLVSAAANLTPGTTLDIHVVDGGIATENRNRLARSLGPYDASLTWIAPDPRRLAGLPLSGRMSVHTYHRVLAGEILPQRASRAVWLDSDLLVLADLSALLNLDQPGCAVLAAQDAIVPCVSSPLGIGPYRELGLPADAKYFNAGVMVMDLERWRRQEVAARTIDYLRRYGHRVCLWDQEGLNAVLAGQWGELDPRWNQSAEMRRLAASKARRFTSGSHGMLCDDPWILHFTGNLKPWLGARRASQALYFRYVDLTAWRGWRPAVTLTGAALARYESSRLRTWLYPAERWLFHGWRILTRSVTPDSHRVPSRFERLRQPRVGPEGPGGT